MSKTFNFQATEKTILSKMDEHEIRKMVEKEADRFIESLPESVQLADVNSVQLRSSPREVADTGVWAQWTRACCGHRKNIADFTYPEIAELQTGFNANVEKKFKQDHFDSDFAVRAVARALK